MINRILGVSSILLLFFGMVFSAQAGDARNGWYGSIGGGMAFGEDRDYTRTTPPGGFARGHLDIGDDFIVEGAVGYAFDLDPNDFHSYRIEGELSHMQNDVNSVFSSVNSSTLPRDGDVEVTRIMANFLIDLHLPDRGTYLTSITPYVGAGLGFAHTEMDFIRQSGGSPFVQLDTKVENGVAWQLIAGLNLPLSGIFSNSLRNWSVDLEYKFMGAGNTISGRDIQTAGPPSAPNLVTVDNEPQHLFTIGVNFGR